MAGLGLGLLFVSIWASAFTAIKGVVPEWPAIWGLATRFACVAAILLAVMAWRRAALPRRGDGWRLAAMGVFGSALYLAASWQAATVLPSGLIALLAATAPLFVAAGEVLFLRQRIPLPGWAGLGLGWLGIAVLGVGRGAGGVATAELWGVALVLAGALSQAAGILAFAPARRRIEPWTANAVQATVAAVTLLALALLAEPALPPAPSPTLVLSLLYGVLVVGVGGYALFFVMLEKLPPASAAALQLLAPPLAAVFGWALLGERLGWTDVAGGLVTLAGLALLVRARR